MKQLFFIAVLFCCAFVSVSAQKAKTSNELTEKQWDSLFSALGSENWNTAFDLSTKYLKQLNNDNEADSIANLRYICLYSAAGKVSEGNMTYAQLEEFVKDFVGKKVVTPFHPVAVKCQGKFNFICASDGSPNKVSVAATNQPGTTIFAFEYTQLLKDFDFAKHSGKEAAVGGVVKSIVPNPNKSTLLIMRIYISDGYIILAEEVKQKKTNK